MAGRLQRGRHPQPGRLAVQRDDARAHAPGGAADYQIYVGHGWIARGYFTSPYCLRTARSVSRFASLMRHIGSRNSGSIIPAIAIASLMGMGLVSRNAARASGKSRWWSSRARFQSLSSAAGTISAVSLRTTVALTELTPWPPTARGGNDRLASRAPT